MREKLHGFIRRLVTQLQRFTDRVWYPPLIGFLAALDNLIVVIPNDGILVSSAMLTPKRWFVLAACVAIGSTVGAMMLAFLIEHQGLPWILQFFPNVQETSTWQWTDEFFQRYGLIIVFAVAASPFLQQPAVILAGLANTPLWELAAVIFAGRFIKFLAMAYIGSHAPRLVGKLYGMKGELEDVGVKTDAA